MNGILADTLWELRDRKVIYLFAFVTIIAVLVIFAGERVSIEFGAGSGDLEGGGMADGLLAGVIIEGLNLFMTLLVFLTAMATAGLIPGMLERGRSEFYLARPISRTRLLVARLGSIWIVYGVLIMACGLVAMIFASMLVGFGEAGVIWLFVVYALNLFIWLCVICLGGILFRSGVGAIMLAFLVWLLRKVPGLLDWVSQFYDSRIIPWIRDTIFYLVPDSSGMGEVATRLAAGQSVSNWMPVWHSTLVAIVMLLLAIWVFKRRDY